MTNVYVMHSRWHVNAGLDAMWDLIERQLASSDPMPWWRGLDVVDNDGKEMQVVAHSPVGYSLRFCIHDLITERPVRMTYASAGDLRGSGSTGFSDNGPDACILDFSWTVTMDRLWMRATSPLLRPLFVFGHDRIMAQGERHINRRFATRAQA